MNNPLLSLLVVTLLGLVMPIAAAGDHVPTREAIERDLVQAYRITFK